MQAAPTIHSVASIIAARSPQVMGFLAIYLALLKQSLLAKRSYKVPCHNPNSASKIRMNSGLSCLALRRMAHPVQNSLAFLVRELAPGHNGGQRPIVVGFPLALVTVLHAVRDVV